MTQHTYREILSPEQDVFDGLLFIPDISGFTELVHSTDVQTGKQITCELLSAIINENILEMEIAEIEGDAVLFYRNGVAPGPRQLFQQYEKMTISFEAKCKELQRKFSMPQLHARWVHHSRHWQKWSLEKIPKESFSPRDRALVGIHFL